MSLTDQGKPNLGHNPPRPRCPLDYSLVVLALVLRDVELCVQLVQQSVRALLTQGVIHICLPRHDVKEVASDLQKELTLRSGPALLIFH